MTLWEAVKKIILDGGSLWFLYTLFVFFLIFPAITLIYDKFRVSRYIIPVVFFGLMIVSPYAPSTLTLSCVTRYLFMFYIGFVVKKNFSRLAEQGRKIKKYALSISSVSFVMWCAVVYVICYVRDVFILNVVAGFLGMICIVPLVMRFSDSIVLKPFESIGKYSLQLYIFNGFTLTAARIVIVNFLGVTSPVIVILFNMFVTLVVTYFVNRYIIFKIKPLRFLCGG